MRKIAIKELVEFARKKTENSKKTFANNLRKEINKTNVDTGGDYWISSLSAISNVFKHENLELIDEKIVELREKIVDAEYDKSRIMYRRNIEILNGYENWNFNKFKPKRCKILKQHKEATIVNINGLPIKVTPHHVFVFEKNNKTYVGGIWFVAKKEGFSKMELGMFSDALYRSLMINYSEEYSLSTEYCFAIDVVNKFDVNYMQMQNNEVSFFLDKIILELKAIKY